MKTFAKITLWSFLAILLFQTPFVFAQENQKDFAEDVILLSDFSQEIIAYFDGGTKEIPESFNAYDFFEILEKNYSDPMLVKKFREKYRVEVRTLGKDYSAMLCDPVTGQKVMEDFSCKMASVEIQPWKSAETQPCVFEVNWKSFCQQN